MMKVYVTKYALSAGIQEMEAERASTASDMVRVAPDRAKGYGFDQYFHGKDWHADREAAVARADEMRKAKIASVKKQLAKLEAMTF